jgi:hypothetical protein
VVSLYQTCGSRARTAVELTGRVLETRKNIKNQEITEIKILKRQYFQIFLYLIYNKNYFL